MTERILGVRVSLRMKVIKVFFEIWYLRSEQQKSILVIKRQTASQKNVKCVEGKKDQL